MIYDINEIKIIKDLTISVDGETDIKYIDKNNEEVEKWITSELLVELYREKDKEIERLNNIIKEVREWVYKIQLDNKRLEPIISTDELDGILEILDKEK